MSTEDALKGWNQIALIMDLIVSKAKISRQKTKVLLDGKIFLPKHYVIAKLILKDLRKKWLDEEIKEVMTFREYYEDRKRRG